jgi:hypothetical protein
MAVLGGVYMFIDALDRPVLGADTTIIRFESNRDAFIQTGSIDVRTLLMSGEKLVAVTPLYTGEIAFATSSGGIGVVDADLNTVLAYLYIPGVTVIQNGIAVDETGGIYVLSGAGDGIFRLDWDAASQSLGVTWSYRLESVGRAQPTAALGGFGNGTTPTLLGTDYVAIADDAYSFHAVVLRRKKSVPDSQRLYCTAQPFGSLLPATNLNSFTAVDNHLYVTDSDDLKQGVARVDVNTDGCALAWSRTGIGGAFDLTSASKASGHVYLPDIIDGHAAVRVLDPQDGHDLQILTPPDPVTNLTGLGSEAIIDAAGRLIVGTTRGVTVYGR